MNPEDSYGRQIERKIQDLCTENEQLKKDFEMLKLKNNELTYLREENDSLHKKVKEHTDTLSKQNEEIKQLQRLNKENEQIDELMRENEEMRKKTEDQGEELDYWRKRCQQLEARLRQQVPQKSVSLCMHCPLKQELADAVVKEMSSSLKCHLEMEGVDVQVDRCAPGQPIPVDGTPVMVLCMNASRLGTDAGQALRGVTGGENVLLIVLHHKETHALPTQSSDKLLFTPEFKQLAAIVDVAFLSGKGMYPCDMNNTALQMISQFLGTFAT